MSREDFLLLNFLKNCLIMSKKRFWLAMFSRIKFISMELEQKFIEFF